MRSTTGLGLGLLFGASLALAACGGSGVGYDQPPASLNPSSPKLVANNIDFDIADVDVPSGAPFVLVFENAENVGHNVSVYADATYQTRLMEGIVFNGPATRWYPVPSLAAGTYVFRCDLHPDMAGRLHAS
jgi:plastocyanin